MSPAHALSAPLALLALALPAQGQGRNVQLLGRYHQHDRYNDVWGYRAPDGREYALVGTYDGTAIVDCSDPRAPRPTGFIPGHPSIWRDIRTWGTHAYVVTEGGPGIQIVDLSNAQSPVLAATWGTTLMQNAHNICIDTGTGRIYCAGATRGTLVADASADPINPTFIGNWVPSGGDGYIHDLHVENGLGHAAAMGRGHYLVFDPTVWPFATRASLRSPGSFTHSAWPNRAQTRAVTTDEVTGGVAQVWDITNPRAPVARGRYTPNPAATPHNVFVLGDVAHLSFYTEGYRAIDISDADNPREIGSYDTWPGATGGYNGAWGCYPFQPSGAVYISDISTGLYVLQLNPVDVVHAPRADTVDELGPYEVRAQVTSASAVSAVRVMWSVDGGAWLSAAMTPTSTPGEYVASIPGQRAPAFVDYALEVDNAAGRARFPSPVGAWTFRVGRYTRKFFDDFEGGSNGWTHGFTRSEDDWQQGVLAARGGDAQGVLWSDPILPWSGSSVWANDLGNTPDNGRYFRDVSNWLRSPSIRTDGVQGLRLRFRRFLSVEDAQFDQARVLVNGQVVWQNPTGQHVVDTAWQAIDLDIASIADTASTLRVEFTLDSNGGLQLGGWTLDDLEVYRLGDCVPPERYGTGSPGTGGRVPTIATSGDPRIGNASLRVTGASMRGGSDAFLAIGFARTSVPIAGIVLLVDQIAATVPVRTSGTAGAAGAGSASVALPVPNDPSLDDVDVFLQWLVVDPGAPGGIAASSDGLRVRVCRG